MNGTPEFHSHSATLSKDDTQLRGPNTSGTHQASPADSHNFPFPVRNQVLRKPKLWGYKSLLTAISRCSELCLDLFAQAAPKDSAWSSFSFLPVLKAEMIRLSTNTLQNCVFQQNCSSLLWKYFREMCKASGLHLKWKTYSKEPLERNGWKIQHIPHILLINYMYPVFSLVTQTT